MNISKMLTPNILIACICCLFSTAVNSAIVGIDLRPASTTVGIGESFDIGVYFTGDQFYATSDIGLAFDSTVVQFNNWAPGTGILSFSSANNFPMSESAPFSGNLADTSSGLLLATVNFTAMNLGAANISIDPVSFLMFTAPGEFDPGDLFDTSEIIFSSAQVQVVPLPAAVWLFGTGLMGMIGVARISKVKT